ncbi:hypothetical protein LIER_04934 [Lithospermum erythrorhizon]|uniref:Uncharacterized protein n=1 Tax=Lithospermum erythrorhizon TaxID=34254 RepID=A0AAV3NYU0_LITER
MEEFNERAYVYIQIDEVEKRADKAKGKRPMNESPRRSPEPRRRSALDRIREPEKAYTQSDLPRGSTFSRLQNDLRKREEVKEVRIEYLTLLKTSVENVFLEIEERRMLPRPARKKSLPSKRDMSKYC